MKQKTGELTGVAQVFYLSCITTLKDPHILLCFKIWRTFRRPQVCVCERERERDTTMNGSN